MYIYYIEKCAMYKSIQEGVFQLKNIMISIKVNMHSYHTVYTCIFFFYAMLCNFCNTLGFFSNAMKFVCFTKLK